MNVVQSDFSASVLSISNILEKKIYNFEFVVYYGQSICNLINQLTYLLKPISSA